MDIDVFYGTECEKMFLRYQRRGRDRSSDLQAESRAQQSDSHTVTSESSSRCRYRRYDMIASFDLVLPCS